MNLDSIQGRLGLLLLVFFALVTVSVVATFWGIETQKKDALVINLAGRQRMLVQQMTRLALEIEKGKDEDHLLALQEAADTFEQTLEALSIGGAAPYLPDETVEVPATRQPKILSQLDKIRQTWAVLHSSLEVIKSTDPGAGDFKGAIQSVESLSLELVEQADLAVRMYEMAANQKTARLRWVQAGFFITALALLLGGALFTRKTVTEPLHSLKQAAQNIGQGDLEKPVQVEASGEIRLLADTLDSMRVQLNASRQELLDWTDSLEERVAQRTRELEALYQVSRDITSRLDIRHVLQTVTNKAGELLQAEVAFLCLLDEDGQALNLQATRGPAEAVIRSQAVADSALTINVLGRQNALPCGVKDCLGSCGIVAEHYRQSHLAAPLRMGERVIGALCVGNSRSGIFSEEAESLLTRLADSAAIALENARLYSQAERLAILEERQRIAADMHDGLAQTLSYLQLQVDQANEQVESGQSTKASQTLVSVHAAMDRATKEIRRAIASLQEDFPLRYTLQEQLAKLAEEFSLPEWKVVWDSSINVPLVLPGEKSEQILRVMREALLNAQRHSQARDISLRLMQKGDQGIAIVEDNGQGFDPRAHGEDDGRQHFGLDIMHARAARIGGKVEVFSQPGQGTQVVLTWPIDRNIAGNEKQVF